MGRSGIWPHWKSAFPHNFLGTSSLANSLGDLSWQLQRPPYSEKRLPSLTELLTSDLSYVDSSNMKKIYHALKYLDPGLICGSGRFPGEGNGNPHQSSCLENFMDRGAWWVIIKRVPKSRTQMSDKHFHFIHFNMKKKKISHTLRYLLIGIWQCREIWATNVKCPRDTPPPYSYSLSSTAPTPRISDSLSLLP